MAAAHAQGKVTEDASQNTRRRFPAVFMEEARFVRNIFYLLLQSAVCVYARIVHDFTIEGLENVPKEGTSALFVGLHTYNTTDISVACLCSQRITGRVVYALMHRPFVYAQPWLVWLGLVPGERGVATALLKAGKLVACLPGGAEEFQLHASGNGREAYELLWKSYHGTPRRGFAHVALEAGPGTRVHPVFCENGEEMKFNVLVELWALLRLDHLWGRLTRACPRPLGWALFWVGLLVAGPVALTGIPVPVKECAGDAVVALVGLEQVTLHVGEAVVACEGESAEELCKRVHDSLQSLIDTRMGRRHRSYLAGLRQRFGKPSGKLD